jgi:hypothetical protein
VFSVDGVVRYVQRHPDARAAIPVPVQVASTILCPQRARWGRTHDQTQRRKKTLDQRAPSRHDNAVRSILLESPTRR